jgi:hypothetical protein
MVMGKGMGGDVVPVPKWDLGISAGSVARETSEWFDGPASICARWWGGRVASRNRAMGRTRKGGRRCSKGSPSAGKEEVVRGRGELHRGLPLEPQPREKLRIWAWSLGTVSTYALVIL